MRSALKKNKTKNMFFFSVLLGSGERYTYQSHRQPGDQETLKNNQRGLKGRRSIRRHYYREPYSSEPLHRDAVTREQHLGTRNDSRKASAALIETQHKGHLYPSKPKTHRLPYASASLETQRENHVLHVVETLTRSPPGAPRQYILLVRRTIQ